MPSTRTQARHRIFGHIPGYPEGSLFDSREALAHAGVHRPTQAGISGTKAEGADSIVLSEGYADDVDQDDIIIYTGRGGRANNSSRLVADQDINQPNNAGLVTSELNGFSVRVTRRILTNGKTAYRYDGLYGVESHWVTRGQDGFRIIQYRLVKLNDAGQMVIDPEQDPAFDDTKHTQNTLKDSKPEQDPTFRETRIVRRVRDSARSRAVKRLYDHHCQMCGVQIQLPGGRLYAEGAHIRPLGRPHQGSDLESNLLCLCPNHHVLLDQGALHITADGAVTNLITGETFTLEVHPAHRINPANLDYLQNHWNYPAAPPTPYQ